MTAQSIYKDKVALITGGASGIGAAIGRQIASQGARVVLADRQLALAESVAASIRDTGASAIAFELDVRNMAAMTNVVASTIARWGNVDYFFNNAGIGIGGEAEDYEPRDWDDVFDVNLRGVAYGIQAVYPVMRRQRSGHIVNTASVAGLVATPGQVAYSASKHAVVGLSKSLRVEAKHYGIRVSALCPGVIRTPILTGGKFGRTNTVTVSDEKMLKMWERLRPMDADLFASKVLSAVARNEPIIVVPGWWKLVWMLDRLSPALHLKVMDVVFERMRASLGAEGARTPQRQREMAEANVSPSPKSKIAN